MKHGWSLVMAGAALLAAIVPTHPAKAAVPVELALVLAVDISGSVNIFERLLQTPGIANAFRDPAVLDAIAKTAPNGIAVTLIYWSGETQQSIAVEWTQIRDTASAEAFASRIETARLPFFSGRTAPGNAMDYALNQLRHVPYEAARRTIDVSGDGRASQGLEPGLVRDVATTEGVTINGLAIVNEEPDLEAYYREHIAGGPDAFVIVADSFDSFAEAMRRKLLREIGNEPAIGALPVPRRPFLMASR